MIALLLALAVAAAAPPARCIPMEQAKAKIEKMHGEWSALNADQWQFARAISVVSPNTPAGLPFGDTAELVTLPDGSGMVLFQDGESACDPMPVPASLIAILKTVGDGKITREGEPL